MFKSVLAAASLAVIVANVGCGAAPDSSDSSASDQALAQGPKQVGTGSTTGTLSLAEAVKQVNAIRAKLDPTGDNALLFDASLTEPYLTAIQPIFAQVAPTDKIALGDTAFSYVSNAIISGGILDLGLDDDAVATFAQLWDISRYLEGTAAPAVWTKLNLLIEHSSAAPLSDLQLLSLVTNVNPTDLFAGLQAVHWGTARAATAADVAVIPDNDNPFSVLNDDLFGPAGYARVATDHDLDVSNTFAVSVFTRSYSEIRLLAADQTDLDILVDLGGHMETLAEGVPSVRPTKTIDLAKSVLTANEVKIFDLHL